MISPVRVIDSFSAVCLGSTVRLTMVREHIHNRYRYDILPGVSVAISNGRRNSMETIFGAGMAEVKGVIRIEGDKFWTIAIIYGGCPCIPRVPVSLSTIGLYLL